jgi:hypothetical protein
MKLFVSLLGALSVAGPCDAQSYYSAGWELLGFTTDFRVSPISWGAGSSAAVSAAIVTETNGERSQDALPNRGLFGKGWPSGAPIDPMRYIEFTLNSASETPLFIEYVQIPLFRESPNPQGKGEHGPRKWSLRWSRDGYSEDLGQIDISDNNDRSQTVFRVDLWQREASAEAATFRLYGYDSPSSEGSGGVVVASHKLYIESGVRRPLLDIPPRVLRIRPPVPNNPTYLSIDFEGSYGKTFGLEKSENLSTWVPAGFPDKTMEVENSASFYFYTEADKGNMFYRVVER